MADFMFCTKCHSDAMMQIPVKTPDGGVRHTCLDDHGGTGPWSFTVYPNPAPAAAAKTPAEKRTRTSSSSSRVSTMPAVPPPPAKNDLLEPLLECFEVGGPWLEYGVVEAKLREIAPAVFARHVREAGHTMFGATSTTASGRIAMALGALRAQRKLVTFTAPSTGRAWGGKPTSFWGLDKLTPRTQVLTWASYRAEQGLPDDWTEDDRAGLTPARRDTSNLVRDPDTGE